MPVNHHEDIVGEIFEVGQRRSEASQSLPHIRELRAIDGR
jgi:hypothetical protein